MVTFAKILHRDGLVTVVFVGSSFLHILAKVEEETENSPSLYTPRERNLYQAGDGDQLPFSPSKRGTSGTRLFSLKTIQIKRLTMIMSFCHTRLSSMRGAGTLRFKNSFPHRFRARVV